MFFLNITHMLRIRLKEINSKVLTLQALLTLLSLQVERL